jgi:hypothetical protein
MEGTQLSAAQEANCHKNTDTLISTAAVSTPSMLGCA